MSDITCAWLHCRTQTRRISKERQELWSRLHFWCGNETLLGHLLPKFTFFPIYCYCKFLLENNYFISFVRVCRQTSVWNSQVGYQSPIWRDLGERKNNTMKHNISKRNGFLYIVSLSLLYFNHNCKHIPEFKQHIELPKIILLADWIELYEDGQFQKPWAHIHNAPQTRSADLGSFCFILHNGQGLDMGRGSLIYLLLNFLMNTAPKICILINDLLHIQLC